MRVKRQKSEINRQSNPVQNKVADNHSVKLLDNTVYMYNLEFVIGDVSVQGPGLVYKSGVWVLGLNLR